MAFLYMPREDLAQFNKQVADFYLKKGALETEDESLKKFCLTQAVEFMNDQENLKRVGDWLKGGKAVVDGHETTFDFADTFKYSFLKKYFAS
mmetsp:Transcript_23445/g.36121  ORF Transcript_23445/g.36121 Transcript_23445/m.36121 type:complete len:92 (-) Transcript_23445:509-784(-)